jgi:hypothetical protein
MNHSTKLLLITLSTIMLNICLSIFMIKYWCPIQSNIENIYNCYDYWSYILIDILRFIVNLVIIIFSILFM